ncbi:MAG: STAS domain-containing protein [Candidatus Riflebacteria bacterium]|nr:STAS domain-containing protein [Candidatus Riflebacteria bacterium]
MQLHIETTGGVSIVRPLEDVDPANSSQLERTLIEQIDGGVRCIILDLSRVGYIESSGIGAIVRAYRRMKDISGEIILSGCNENLMKIFKLINFQRYFRMTITLSEALESLAKPVPG